MGAILAATQYPLWRGSMASKAKKRQYSTDSTCGNFSFNTVLDLFSSVGDTFDRKKEGRYFISARPSLRDKSVADETGKENKVLALCYSQAPDERAVFFLP